MKLTTGEVMVCFFKNAGTATGFTKEAVFAAVVVAVVVWKSCFVVVVRVFVEEVEDLVVVVIPAIWFLWTFFF